MSSALKNKILSGVFWQGLEKVGSQGISFAIQIVLARLLAPKDFGVIALMMVFIALCNVVVDSGFSSALIQKKDATQTDFCSVFFINIVLGVFLYGVMFFAAPWVARFYDSPDLTRFLRFSSLALVITSFSRVQQAYLNRNMLFHLSFRINWIALLVSGATGIVMAYRGFGAWALIAQQLCNAAVQCLLLWLLVKWRPHRLFDWSRAKSLFRFGWKFLASTFLNTFYNDLYGIVIGKIADLTSLSYYNRGKSIPMFGMGIINSTVGSVLFPAFSQIQDDRVKMRELAKRGLRNIMFLVIPALTLLFILAEPLVRILLTDKWLPCVIYLQLCCITACFWPLHTTNLQIINACGRSDVFLILEILKKIQALAVIAVTYRFGVKVMVAAEAAMGGIYFVENAWVNRRLIGYPPWRQAADVLPALCVAALSGAVGYWLVHYVRSPWGKLVVGGSVFTVLYIAVMFAARQIPGDILNLMGKRKGSPAL